MNMMPSAIAQARSLRKGGEEDAGHDAGQTDFLTICGLEAGYAGTRVLKGIDLSVSKGEFIALLGSSGCGKSTLLRTLAGFAKPDAGEIRVAGRNVTRLGPDKRGMALVFQSYALWPHMSVAQNIGYGLKLAGRAKTDIASRVGELQMQLGLGGLEQRKPAELSGGQRQRVALARALAVQPDILLLDEPLSNLDARIRLTVRHEIIALQRRLGTTAIHVTHDREEAMVMADRIVILNEGAIAQVGTPQDVYKRPASAFVAAFMGAENCLPLSIEKSGAGLHVHANDLCEGASLPIPSSPLVSGPVEARFRPQAVELTPHQPQTGTEPGGDGAVIFKGRVEQTSYPGGAWRHVVSLGSHSVVADAPRSFTPGEAVNLRVTAEDLFLFSPA